MTELIFLVVVVTSLGVLVDSISIGVRRGRIKGFFNMGPAGWFFSCLLLWILAFPAYLVKRNEYRRVAAMEGQPAGIHPEDIPHQISKLAELRAQGVVTDGEFQAKKKELLSRM